jgi:hypothetical protein
MSYRNFHHRMLWNTLLIQEVFLERAKDIAGESVTEKKNPSKKKNFKKNSEKIQKFNKKKLKVKKALQSFRSLNPPPRGDSQHRNQQIRISQQFL